MSQPGCRDLRASQPQGFEGDVTGLGLSAIIELEAQSHFTGCLDVQCGDRRGLLFFRRGELVHAETGGATGETALREISSWPHGRCLVLGNVASLRATCVAPFMDPEPSATPTWRSTGELLARLRLVPGVVRVVLRLEDGTRVGDLGDADQALASQALQTAMLARGLGASFETGELLSATLEGAEYQLLHLLAGRHALTALVEPERSVGVVEAELRALLGLAS